MPLATEKERELARFAKGIRATVVKTIHHAQSGHPGGSLSCVDILSVLYKEKMRFDPNNLSDPGRDRLVLSKGHACPTLYAILAELGVFAREELQTLRRLGSRLQGHPDMNSLPGIEISSGPLGLGLSVGLGMAMSARLDNLSYKTYVLMGDGELQEGIVWEAAMAAAKYGASDLIALVDVNELQLDGPTHSIMPLGDLTAKFLSFGWHVLRADGHDMQSLAAAIDLAYLQRDLPTVILCKTIKGKGVSFMEGETSWHGNPIDRTQFARAMQELEVDDDA